MIVSDPPGLEMDLGARPSPEMAAKLLQGQAAYVSGGSRRVASEMGMAEYTP